eukprot:g962.t1
MCNTKRAYDADDGVPGEGANGAKAGAGVDTGDGVDAGTDAGADAGGDAGNNGKGEGGGACSDKEVTLATNCPGGHGLSEHPSAGSGCVCVLCGEKTEAAGTRVVYQCHRCKYNVCALCYQPERDDAPAPVFAAQARHPPNCLRATAIHALEDVCTEAECLDRRAHASLQRHSECGHRCGGVRGDDVLGDAELAALEEAGDDAALVDCENGAARMLRCLECSGEADDYCAICFVEGLGAAPVIELESCGHCFHEHCLRGHIELGWGKKASLDFSSLKCPACKQVMQHRLLEPAMAKTKAMYKEAARQALVAAARDGLEGDEQLVAKVQGQFGGSWEKYLVEAHYDFRPCGKCKQPFNAGLKECGAAGAGTDADAEVDLSLIQCPTCQNNAKAECPKHGKDYIAWKCRYCCGNCGDKSSTGMAVYACFGYLHACAFCHDYKNLDKMMDFSKPEPYPNKLESYDPHPISGLKCDPATCPFGGNHPPNGVEYCLGCTLCAEEERNAANAANAAAGGDSGEEEAAGGGGADGVAGAGGVADKVLPRPPLLRDGSQQLAEQMAEAAAALPFADLAGGDGGGGGGEGGGEEEAKGGEGDGDGGGGGGGDGDGDGGDDAGAANKDEDEKVAGYRQARRDPAARRRGRLARAVDIEGDGDKVAAGAARARAEAARRQLQEQQRAEEEEDRIVYGGGGKERRRK